jgi:riboflavin synthase
MFTGIVSDVGDVLAVTPRAEGLKRVTIACGYPRDSLIDGASMACSGICLTLVGAGEDAGRSWFSVDTAAETLMLTTAGRW